MRTLVSTENCIRGIEDGVLTRDERVRTADPSACDRAAFGDNGLAGRSGDGTLVRARLAQLAGHRAQNRQDENSQATWHCGVSFPLRPEPVGAGTCLPWLLIRGEPLK